MLKILVGVVLGYLLFTSPGHVRPKQTFISSLLMLLLQRSRTKTRKRFRIESTRCSKATSDRCCLRDSVRSLRFHHCRRQSARRV